MPNLPIRGQGASAYIASGGFGGSAGNACGAGGAAISGSGYTVTGTTSQIYGSY